MQTASAASAADVYPGRLNFLGSPQSPSFDQTFGKTCQGATRICSCAMPRGGSDGELRGSRHDFDPGKAK
jgi:hypothetical protein